MITSIREKILSITNYLKYIIVAMVSFLLGYGCYAIFNIHTTAKHVPDTIKESKDSSKTPTEIHEVSNVTLKEKQKTSDPDLVVDNRYIAEVNGQTFEIPKESGIISNDSKGSTKDSKGLQTKVTSDINITPIVRKMADLEYKRNWEVSTGIGRSHDGHFYVPIGIQRNYNYDKAIEVSVGLNKDHVENIQVLHKWKF